MAEPGVDEYAAGAGGTETVVTDATNANEHPIEPNEYGFAGGATAPQPDRADRDSSAAEGVAVPGDDLTDAASDALAEETTDDDAR